MSSQVYLDFGSGFQNISAFVKYDTLVVDPKAFSENFHFAQNSASFDIIYDSDLFIAIRAADTIICKIESGLGAPMFYGKISPSKSRSYDGIVNNEIWSLQAEDQLQELDQPVGDICYSGYAVMNPADTDHSIVHQLAYRAGFTAGQVGSVTISTVIDKFVPNDEDDSILDILDTLLFEYQYALNMDATGKITPLQWSKTSPVTHTFNEDNIMLNVDIVDSDTTYYGAKVTWYEVEQATTTSGNQYLPLYNDSNFSYVQGTGWTPYPLLAGFSYPPETNVIDPTTGLPTVVNQQYDESAVSYLTNYAVVNKIDYNYKAFQSDFSSIVSTSDWQVEYSADPGITVASTFGNKQAAVVFDNPTASTQNLYYFRILGKVWYKSAERMMEVKNTAVSGRKLDEYVSNWIFDSTTAGGLVTNLARQYAAGSITYTFTSEEVIALGSCGTIVMNNGTNQKCMVTEGPWDEGRRQYTYTLRAYSPNTGVISKQHYKVASSSVATALAQDAQATADSALPMSSIGLVSMHRMDEMPEIPDGLSGTIIKQNPIPSLSGYITDGSISLVDGKIVIDPAGFSDLFRTSESCPINSWFIVEVESSAPSLLAFYNNGIAQNTISPSVVIPGEKKIYCYLIPSALSIGNRYGLWTTGGYGATVSKWYLGDFSYSSFPLDGTGLGLNATSAIGVLPVQAKYGKAIQGSLTASVQAPCSYGAVWTECFRFKLSVLGKSGEVSLLYGASDTLSEPLVNSILLQRQTYGSSDGDFLKIYVSDQVGNYVESWYDDDYSAYVATHYLFDGV